MFQYLELLTSPTVVSPQDYANKVLPPLAELAESYGICAPICMHIIRPVLNAKLLVSYLFRAVYSNADIWISQAAAEAMPEQERIANEEAEKRLKAALTAKKPLIAASRTASPGVGAADAPVDSKPAVPDATPKEDVSMEVEPTSLTSAPPALEVAFMQNPNPRSYTSSESLATGTRAFVRGCQKDSTP